MLEKRSKELVANNILFIERDTNTENTNKNIKQKRREAAVFLNK